MGHDRSDSRAACFVELSAWSAASPELDIDFPLEETGLSLGYNPHTHVKTTFM